MVTSDALEKLMIMEGIKGVEAEEIREYFPSALLVIPSNLECVRDMIRDGVRDYSNGNEGRYTSRGSDGVKRKMREDESSVDVKKFLEYWRKRDIY